MVASQIKLLIEPRSSFLLFQLSSGQLVEQKLSLSSSFKCYQIHSGHRYDFGHIL